MSFRSKAALTIAVLTALALGGAFTAVSAAFIALQRRQLDASLREVAAQEAAEAAVHRFSFSERPGPAANDVGPLDKYGVMYDESGRVLAATSPFDRAPPLRRNLGQALDKAFDLGFGGSHLRGILVPIPGHAGKVLFLATSRDDLDGDGAFLHRAMMVAFVVAVAWVAAVAYWMGGRLTLAHHAIARAVRTVTQGDLSARVRIHASDPEVAQLGNDINEMVGRLGDLLTSQQRFLAHAAHELRSPLAALHGELQQALRKERDTDGYKKAIEAALAASRRLNLLAEDLLTLARSQASGEVADGRIAVDVLVGEACSVVQTLARQRGVDISVGVAANCWVPDRNGDTVRLLRNLLENAIRHSPENGVVSVAASTTQEAVRISVCDEGPGVPDAERSAIFEPFFRSKGSMPTEGAGLGLGIAREIARSHGGDVSLEAASLTSSRGARFVVSLPARESPSR